MHQKNYAEQVTERWLVSAAEPSRRDTISGGFGSAQPPVSALHLFRNFQSLCAVCQIECKLLAAIKDFVFAFKTLYVDKAVCIGF